MEKDYIIRLKEKIKDIDDYELKDLINKLISEREYLINTTKLDSLTGLYNKSILNSIKYCSIAVMFDIDNFKTINDTYGHLTGDRIIKEVANILTQNFRSNDYICRFGGDEFFIGITNCDKQIIYNRLEKLKNEVKEKISLPDLPITLSIGMSYNYDNKSLYELIEEADQALYDSKRTGKDTISIYNEQKINKSK